MDDHQYFRPIRHQLDRTGVVFIVDDKVFRKIFVDARQTTLELLHSPLFLELRSKKLIPDTWIERESEDSLVLGHEKADFIIYSSEWSFSMLKKLS